MTTDPVFCSEIRPMWNHYSPVKLQRVYSIYVQAYMSMHIFVGETENDGKDNVQTHVRVHTEGYVVHICISNRKLPSRCFP